MAIVGNLVREKSRADAYEATHQEEVLAWRNAARVAGEQSIKEREERYPVLNAENAAEAIEFQQRRFAEIVKERKQARQLKRKS